MIFFCMVNVEADFVDKKEALADLIEEYMENSDKEKELVEMVALLKEDAEFKSKALFLGVFADVEKFLPELSRKELKQRVSMIRSFIE